MRDRRCIRVGVVGAAAVLVGIPVSLTPAFAHPYEQFRFHDTFSVTRDNVCGDLTVSIDFHDDGVLVGRITGPDGTLRYTASHHGGATTTNLATGRALTVQWNYTEQDLRVTDNGDGTISILTQVPGPETWYGPDGKRIYTSGGTMRLLTIVDYGGTLTDPSDDTFVSQTLISSNGGRAQPALTTCDALHTYTT